MLTILASPKNFDGYIGEIQENAIRSWRRIHPDVEILLFGKCQGAGSICDRYSVQLIESITCSPSGAPHFDAIARYADMHARHNTLLFVNADILLPPDFLEQVKPISWPKYLVIGQRIDLHQGVSFNAATKDWNGEILRLADERRLELHPPGGCDYFLFTRGTWEGLKPLVVGRGGYDPALIAFCFRNHIPVINGSWAIHVVHQWHDYSHVPGQKMEAHVGAEAARNRRDHDVWHSSPQSTDADFALRGGCVVPNPARNDLLRKWEIQLRYKLGWKYGSYGLRLLWRALRAAHCLRQTRLELDELMRHFSRHFEDV